MHWYTEAARQGHAGAQYNLAKKYYDGRLVEQDYEKAMLWFTKAADQGDADAYYYLGCGYYFEEGYPLDLAKGIQLWEEAADRGNTDATFMMGLSYFNGTGVEEDNDRAFALFSKAAAVGDGRALRFLGDCYSNGYGTNIEINKAVECYMKSADSEDEVGQYRLALCYEEGAGIHQDKNIAFELFQLSAENGCPSAQYKLGTLFMTDRNNPPSEDNLIKAVGYLELAAEQEHDDAQFALYINYYSIEGHPCHNPSKGLDYLIKAAENNHNRAQFELGKHLMNGKDISCDVGRGLQIITLSAENGNSDAMIYLGVHYKNGEVVPEDSERALQWFLHALPSRPQDDLLLMEIGHIFSDRENFLEAAKYYEKASALGNTVGAMQAFISMTICGDALLWSIPEAAYDKYQEALGQFGKMDLKEAGAEMSNMLIQTRNEIDLGIGTILYFNKVEGDSRPYLLRASAAGLRFADVLLSESETKELAMQKRPLHEFSGVFNNLYAAIRQGSDTFSPNQLCLSYSFLAHKLKFGAGTQKDDNKSYEYYSIAANQDSIFADSARAELHKFRKKAFGGYEYVG